MFLLERHNLPTLGPRILISQWTRSSSRVQALYHKFDFKYTFFSRTVTKQLGLHYYNEGQNIHQFASFRKILELCCKTWWGPAQCSLTLSVSRSGKGSNERNCQVQPRGRDGRRIGEDSTQVAINKLFGPDKTQCLPICRGKKCLSMTNMKMIDQVCYSLCDKFSTITAFCHDLLCKEGSVRHYYRDNDTFTFSIYNKYLHLHYLQSLRFGFLKYSTVLLTVQR